MMEKVGVRVLWVFLSIALVAACGGGNENLFPDDEWPDSGLGTEVDASIDATPEADAPETCETADDCSAPAHPCQISICIRGLCEQAWAPAGTQMDVSEQVPGDCKRLECGEGGAFVVKADPDDLPFDDGNACTLKTCKGFDPVLVPVDAGAPCAEGGVCNGQGECGVCIPNEQSCEGKVPMTCNASGVWEKGEACPFVCTGEGTCTGSCEPSAVRCNGKQVQTCSAVGEWETISTCPYLCSNGSCGGDCAPESSRCVGSSMERCDSNGSWQAPESCPFVCDPSSGTCSGVCKPGASQCSGNNLQACTATGQWSVTACPYLCQSGECKGSCSPGSLRCSGKNPEACDANGQWSSSGPPCALTCTDGVCTESCTAGAVRCNGRVSEVCAADGTWREEIRCPFACSGSGTCTGVCVPGSKRCSGQKPQICDESGQWIANGADCPKGCAQGACFDYPLSCNLASGAGLSTCGSGGNESCCTSPLVPGGTFYRGYDAVSSSDTSLPATVSAYRLDKYEVTVARFRLFVEAMTSGIRPPAGSGKHSHLSGGAGLNDGTEPGWQSAWNTYLPNTKAAWDSSTGLACSPNATWTASPGANESRPINCVTWHQAQAFCTWDGGFLPSEAEWHYAASGGGEQRVFPWASPATSTMVDVTYASYACMGDGSDPCGATDLLRPGMKPKGQAKWGQLDLSGNVGEWVLDLFGSYPPAPCSNCAALGTTSDPRVIRGGSWKDADPCSLRSAERRSWGPMARSDGIGFRCARAPD